MSKRATSHTKQPSHKARKMEKLTAAAILNNQAIAEGPTRRKTWSIHDLKEIRPMTTNQETVFMDFFQSASHICMHGSAGSGKSFLACYLALNEVLRKDTPQDQIIIVRSAVPTRDIGFLPGDLEEKSALYELPYQDIFADLCKRSSTYENMKEAGLVQFCITSFVRGLSWDNCIVIIDEAQNMSWYEIDSVLTRIGINSRVIICGDTQYQCDLKKERSGFSEAIGVMERTGMFGITQFTPRDIVRSDFVKSWIISREQQGL